MSATKQDVILALLSLDAYSRGADAKLLDVEGHTIGEQIGTTNWGAVSDDISGATAIGFSASSYALADGTKVIAYRGTDKLTSNFWSDTIGSDIWNVYLQGTRLTDAERAGGLVEAEVFGDGECLDQRRKGMREPSAVTQTLDSHSPQSRYQVSVS